MLSRDLMPYLDTAPPQINRIFHQKPNSFDSLQMDADTGICIPWIEMCSLGHNPPLQKRAGALSSTQPHMQTEATNIARPVR